MSCTQQMIWMSPGTLLKVLQFFFLSQWWKLHKASLIWWKDISFQSISTLYNKETIILLLIHTHLKTSIISYFSLKGDVINTLL